MKKWIALGLGVAAIAAAIFFLRRPGKVEVKPVAPAATAPAAVEAILTARIVPRSVVGVNPPIEGTLEVFFVDVGAEVIEGQLLGRVRNGKGDAGLQQAQADLDAVQAQATQLNGELLSARLEVSRSEAETSRVRGELDRLQKAYERQKGLWAAGATARLTFEKSEKDYNDAKASGERTEFVAKQAATRLGEINGQIEEANRAVTEKTAAIERAKQGTNAGELHAPADGIVSARQGQPGDAVGPSTKLIEIATGLTKLQAIAAPDIATLARIHAGQAAMVHLGDEDISGVVQEVRGQEVIVYFDAAMPVNKLEQPAQVKIKF